METFRHEISFLSDLIEGDENIEYHTFFESKDSIPKWSDAQEAATKELWSLEPKAMYENDGFNFRIFITSLSTFSI